jgi:ribosomal protein L35
MSGKVRTKIKTKTHKASAKRFTLTGTGKVAHLPQGGGHGHSRNYMSRRQRKARNGKNFLSNGKEIRLITRLLGN